MLVRTTCAFLLMVVMFAPASAGKSWREGPGIRADIDGDGAPDRLVFTKRAHYFTLRVSTRHGTSTLKVRGFSGFKASVQSLPRIVALRPLNPSPGMEIEVLLWYGASIEELVFYTWHAGRLVPMTGVPHLPRDPPYVWIVGGTIGTGYRTADCIAPQQIGLSGGYPDARRRWVSTAARYDVRGTRFVRTASYRRVTKELPSSPPKGWPQLKNRDFKSCGGVVLDRKRR